MRLILQLTYAEQMDERKESRRGMIAG